MKDGHDMEIAEVIKIYKEFESTLVEGLKVKWTKFVLIVRFINA